MIGIFILVLIYQADLFFCLQEAQAHIYIWEPTVSFIFNYRFKSVLFQPGKSLVKGGSFDTLFIKLISCSAVYY